MEEPAARFTTLRAVVRDWADHRRISELQGLGWDDASEGTGETFTTVWIDAERRVREERASGSVRVVADIEDASHHPLFAPAGWLGESATPAANEERLLAGRRAVAVEVAGSVAASILPGANRTVWLLDRDRGVCLRLEAWLDDELLMIEELVEVAFDIRLDPALFEAG